MTTVLLPVEQRLLTPFNAEGLEALRRVLLTGLCDAQEPERRARAVLLTAYRTDFQIVFADVLAVPADVRRDVVTRARSLFQITVQTSALNSIVPAALLEVRQFGLSPNYVDLLRTHWGSLTPQHQISAACAVLLFGAMLAPAYTEVYIPPYVEPPPPPPPPTPQVWDYRHASGNGGLTLSFAEIHGWRTDLSSGSVVPTVDRLVMRPFFVGVQGLLVQSLSVDQTAGGVGTIRLGIYRGAAPAARTIYPQDLVVDFGTTNTLAGTGRVTSAVVPTLLPNGLYYTCFKRLTGTAQFFYASGGANNNMYVDTQVLGCDMSTPVIAAYNSVIVVDAAVTLPAFFPAGGTLSSANEPIVAVNF